MEHWLLFAWISDASHPSKAAVLSGRIRWRLPIGGDGSLALCQRCFNCTFPSPKGRSSYKQTAQLARRCVARPCPLPSPISPSASSSASPLTIPSKLIEVGSIALHRGDGINSKLISQPCQKNYFQKRQPHRRALRVIRFPLQIAGVKFQRFPLELPCHSGVGWSETGIRAIQRLWNFPRVAFWDRWWTEADNSSYVGRIISQMCSVVWLWTPASLGANYSVLTWKHLAEK